MAVQKLGEVRRVAGTSFRRCSFPGPNRRCWDPPGGPGGSVGPPGPGAHRPLSATSMCSSCCFEPRTPWSQQAECREGGPLVAPEITCQDKPGPGTGPSSIAWGESLRSLPASIDKKPEPRIIPALRQSRLTPTRGMLARKWSPRSHLENHDHGSDELPERGPVKPRLVGKSGGPDILAVPISRPASRPGAASLSL